MRATTTAELIKESYEEMAKTQREFVASSQGSTAAAASSSSAVPSTSDGEQDVRSDDASREEKREAKVTVRASKGRMKWRAQIAEGRVLDVREVSSLGKILCIEYLRAMGCPVTRADETADADSARAKLKAKMNELSVSTWAVSL